MFQRVSSKSRFGFNSVQAVYKRNTSPTVKIFLCQVPGCWFWGKSITTDMQENIANICMLYLFKACNKNSHRKFAKRCKHAAAHPCYFATNVATICVPTRSGGSRPFLKKITKYFLCFFLHLKNSCFLSPAAVSPPGPSENLLYISHILGPFSCIYT